MARKGGRQQTHRGFHTGATDVPSALTPQTCPLCDKTPEGVKGKNGHLVLQTHLMEKHHPHTPCPRVHQRVEAQEWRLDWDAVLHQQARIFYCSSCGFYFNAE